MRGGLGDSGRAGKVALSALVALAAAAPAAAGGGFDVVDLRTAPSWVASGAGLIAPAGDVNGDGLADAAIADCGAADDAGRVRVVFGPFEPGDAAFDSRGPGFSVHGAAGKDFACRLSPVPVGDVNGDGLDDLLVGGELADQSGRSASGAVYVVFGKADEHPVDLEAFDAGTQGAHGYRVDGPATAAFVGLRLAGLGDMNGDGLADFVTGSPFHGASYVVFGQESPAPVDLREFDSGVQGPRGFRIETFSADATHGYSIGAAGDVNDDGSPDVVIGIVRDTHDAPGSAYVVFGKAGTSPVDTTRRTYRGFRIKGAAPGEGTGEAVFGAGDVNGDGLGDVIVGAPKDYSCCRGKAVVVFGKRGRRSVRIGKLGDDGFKVKASQRRDFFGETVAGIGDVDGDGLDDIAIGASGHDYPERGGPGAVFVVFGRKATSKLRTGTLGDDGFVIVGRDPGDRTGRYLGAPGDMDGDGTPDLMITATSAATSYLLWLEPPE